MQLEDWLDDLCVRFIINLPPEELESVERICFQVEEAQWFYEDFIRPLDPSLPSLSLRAFSLRIFQHCPLFSQWSAQHHTTAFAEFLAYKSRVPVRGAIMLNAAMDEVVLVKGWKKGANWSFPRGKINKDENDLDCAVREVYEETGFDIRAAGLVKEEKDMKYIEVTMREQHMRLYVFRGVLKDTQFQPKTRKEISKIQWYKLTDLPTLKKNRHQEGTGESLAVNANKFYMVAPFLVPLKKWIAQQRKKENRISSSAYLAPVIVHEESATEDEHGQTNGHGMPPAKHTNSYAPSNLPEVMVSHSGPPILDPSSHLKALLNVNPVKQVQPDTVTTDAHPSPKIDVKSRALLSLLRQGTTAEKGHDQSTALPATPLDQVLLPPNVPRTPQHHTPRPPPFSSLPPPPAFPIQPNSESVDIRARQDQFEQRSGPHERSFHGPVYKAPPPSSLAPVSLQKSRFQHPAPYHRTGDPQFAQQGSRDAAHPTIPPASALPKLTNHTRALLNVFKTGSRAGNKVEESPVSPAHQRDIAEKQGTPESLYVAAKAPAQYSGPVSTLLQKVATGQSMQSVPPPQPPSVHRANLLDLFRNPSQQSTTSSVIPEQVPILAPVELAAQSTPRSPEKPEQSNDYLLRLWQKTDQGSQKPISTRSMHKANISREGHTPATVSGPLNQPQFEGLAKISRQSSISTEIGRSPNTKNRTLFDPNAPSTVKILNRPEGLQQSYLSSSMVVKPKPFSWSSKRLTTPRETPKPFQPQILRRPKAETPTPTKVPEVVFDAPAFSMQRKTPPPPRATSQVVRQSTALPSAQTFDRRSSQNDVARRANLLSLFSEASVAAEKVPSLRGLPAAASVTASQMVSSLVERPMKRADVMSTRSRIGSVASVVSGGSQIPFEKRQTAAGDKAFLLGYLGRIASREG